VADWKATRLVGVGVFVIVGVLLFTIALFMIGDRQMAFARRFTLYTEFSRVTDLQPGAIVRVSGAKGGEVKDGRVTPSDLGATVFRHLGIDLNAQWIDLQGRPQPIVTEGGRPIPELS